MVPACWSDECWVWLSLSLVEYNLEFWVGVSVLNFVVSLEFGCTTFVVLNLVEFWIWLGLFWTVNFELQSDSSAEDKVFWSSTFQYSRSLPFSIGEKMKILFAYHGTQWWCDTGRVVLEDKVFCKEMSLQVDLIWRRFCLATTNEAILRMHAERHFRHVCHHDGIPSCVTICFKHKFVFNP